MRIRTLTMFVLSGFLILAFLFIQFLMTPLQLEEANGFDQQRVQRDVERVQNYLVNEQDDLLHQTIDWSAWDETYLFVNGENPGYITDNLQPDMIANLQVQIMIYLDQNGSVVYRSGVDRDGATFALSEGFVTTVKEAVARQDLFYESHQGEMVMMASHQITRNDFSDPTGYLIMGRIIDENYLAELSEELSVDVALSTEERIMSLEQADKISGEYIVENLDESFLLPLNVASDRVFYKEKQKNLKKFKTWAAIGFLLITLAVYFLFRQMLLKPIMELASGMRKHDGVALPEGHHLFKKLYEVKKLETEFSDMINDIKRANEEITEMAYHDQLTGLGNRFYLTKMFGSFVNKSKVKKAVIFFDLDGFKKVNDTWGHEVGDLLLKEVAARVKQYFERDQVMISRIGGDEFAVILPYREMNALLDTCEELKNRLNTEFRMGSIRTFISASIGISLFPTDGKDLSMLLKHADAAMYEAKTQGKNQVFLYQDLLAAGRYGQAERLKEESKSVLCTEQLSIVYQPIFEGKVPVISGVEALLRWKHPEYGPLSPELFIEIFEESGAIHEIGRWVLSEGIKNLKEWHKLGYPNMSLSINFSKTQLLHYTEFLETLDQELEAHHIQPHLIIVEITESEVSYYDNDLMHFIEAVQKRRVRIALDDFGKGTSSLYGLRNLPVDIVKIDRSFMESIPYENFNSSILSGIYSLLKQLDIEVVAEGIENEEQLNFIVRQGETKMQGFYFSKPVSPDELTKILTGESIQVNSHPF